MWCQYLMQNGGGWVRSLARDDISFNSTMLLSCKNLNVTALLRSFVAANRGRGNRCASLDLSRVEPPTSALGLRIPDIFHFRARRRQQPCPPETRRLILVHVVDLDQPDAGAAVVSSQNCRE